MRVGGASLESASRFVPYHLFFSAIPLMVEMARTAADNDAFSYRNFNVGASVFAVQPEARRVEVLNGGNTKSRKHKAKICAERSVLDQAKKSGLTQAIGIVVAGTTDVELIREVTGAETPTLHPCDECRQMFDDHPLTRPDTVILTIGQDADAFQVHTQSELQELYTRKNMPPQTTVAADFDNWSSRVAGFDFLSSVEQQVAERHRRSAATLAVMALRS